jgi:ABC-2 type transport system ATP-binding protein
LITLRDLRKSFRTTVAVDGLSLRVARGEVLGMLGPNGAGKTTTISMICGLIAPDSGTVEFEGIGSPSSPRARLALGVAPQNVALYDELSADENLRFFAALYGMPRPRCAARVEALLARVGLTERRRDRVGAYSGGMKRRLNIAAALLHEPAIVLLDEPTAGVDPQSRSAILDLVRGMRAEGTTVVYTTHYMEEAQRICDRVAIVDHGRLLALDTVDALIGKHGGPGVVRIQRDDGESRITTSDPVAVLAAHIASPGVRGVHVDRPDLESVFLQLTGRTLRD